MSSSLLPRLPTFATNDNKKTVFLSKPSSSQSFSNIFHVECMTQLSDGTILTGCSGRSIQRWLRVDQITQGTSSSSSGSSAPIVSGLMKTYIGHAKVIRALMEVCWDHFASCSADCTVAIWHVDKEEPLLSIPNFAAVLTMIRLQPPRPVGDSSNTSFFDNNNDNSINSRESSKRRHSNEERSQKVFLCCNQYGQILVQKVTIWLPTWSSSVGIEDNDYRVQSKKVRELQGHEDLITQLDELPTTNDTTRELSWDVLCSRLSQSGRSQRYEKKRGNLLVSGSLDRTIKLWDWYSCGRCIMTLRNDSKITGVIALDPNHIVSASGSPHSKIKFWNITNEMIDIARERGIVECSSKRNEKKPLDRLPLPSNNTAEMIPSEISYQVYSSGSCVKRVIDLELRPAAESRLQRLNNGLILSINSGLQVWNQQGSCLFVCGGQTRRSITCALKLNDGSTILTATGGRRLETWPIRMYYFDLTSLLLLMKLMCRFIGALWSIGVAH